MRPVFQQSFDKSANEKNTDQKSKTQCTQTSPQANGDTKAPTTIIVSNPTPTVSKNTQTESSKQLQRRSPAKEIPVAMKCHNDENPMLSAEKDFVDVDDLIHFIQNHKPHPQPFVRGYNAVNSASFRDPSRDSSRSPSRDTDASRDVRPRDQPMFNPRDLSLRGGGGGVAAVDNKIDAMPGIKRDRITISGAMRGKSENLSAHRLQDLKRQEEQSKNGSACHPSQDAVSLPGHRKQKSYTATLQIDLKDSEIIPTKPKFDEKLSTNTGTLHDYENTKSPKSNQNSTHIKPSVSSLDGEVEFASNEMVLAKLRPNTRPADVANTTNESKINIDTELYANSSMISQNKTPNNEQDSAKPQNLELSPESPIFETFQEFSEQLALMNAKTSTATRQLDLFGSGESVSDSDELLPPRGQKQDLKAKPRLIKKPPRKSTKLRRKKSQSLSDLTSTQLPNKSSPEGKVKTKGRPSSFIHDENVYDVPKSFPVYENTRNLVSQIKTSDQNRNGNEMSPSKISPHKPTRKSKKSATKRQAEAKDNIGRVITNPPDLIKQTHVNQNVPLSNANPDVTTPAASSAAISSHETLTSSRRHDMRRSASDDIIYEDEQRKIREDLRRLTELHDELVETNDSVKRMWRTIQQDMFTMINQQVDAKTKRSTLPKAMTPNFGGKKRKCVIM